MNLFGSFHKKSKDVYEQIAQGIIMTSLLFCKELDTQDNQYSADAGAEILYFLLHELDRQLLQDVGPEARDIIFDKIAFKIIGDYINVTLKPETPIDIILNLGELMLDNLNERQRIYSKCKCLMVKGNPGAAKGSIIFALSFYIHKALRKTDRNNVDEILWGEKDIVISDLDDFPDSIETMKIHIYAMNFLIENVKIWKKLIKSIPYD